MSLYREVKAFLTRIEESDEVFRLDPAEKIITAVSGGPDSLTLLHLLAQRQLHPAKNIIAAHLDHQLRPSSGEEAQQVCQIAADWGVVCRLKTVDVKRMAAVEGLSIEEAGRKARYQFFGELAIESGTKYIFTGHHAGDQAETVLMHFLRGSGLAGLRGILPLSDLSGYPEHWLVRPLLQTSREEIEAYCKRHQLQPLIDESNADTAFYRNRLRHELLPILEDYNPQIRERLMAMAAVAAADVDYLQRATAEAWHSIHRESGQGWIRFDLAGWQQLHLSLRRGTLRLALAELRPSLRDVGFQTIEQAREVGEKGEVGAESTLPGEVRLSVGYDFLLLSLPDAHLSLPAGPQLDSDAPRSLPVPGRLELENGWEIKTEWVTTAESKAFIKADNSWVAHLDLADSEGLVVRPRLAGEWFQPLGMAGHSKRVKEVMIDRKIPAELRPRWPIVAGSHLLWIAGHLIDERVRVREDSQRILKLSMRKRDQEK